MKVIETTEGFVFELKDRELFDPRSIRKFRITEGIGAIIGVRKKRDMFEVQAVRFAKEQFPGQEAAETWIRENLDVEKEMLELFGKGEVLGAQVFNISEAEQKLIAVLGLEAVHKGELERARKILEGLIALNAESNLGYMGMGKLHQKEGNPDAALASYKEALNRNPSDMESMMGTAEIHLAKGRKKPALPLLLQIEALDAEEIEPVGVRARKLLKSNYSTKDYEEFLAHGSRVLERMDQDERKQQRLEERRQAAEF